MPTEEMTKDIVSELIQSDAPSLGVRVEQYTGQSLGAMVESGTGKSLGQSVEESIPMAAIETPYMPETW